MSESKKMEGKVFKVANPLLNDRQTEMYADQEDEELKDQYWKLLYEFYEFDDILQ